MSSKYKNRTICRYLDQCKYKDTCFRCHNKSEYRPIECKFKGCFNLDCRFYHPYRETIDEYINKCNVFNQNVKKFTKFCRKMKENEPCTTKGCPFAHSLDEIVLINGYPNGHKLEEAEKVFNIKVEPFMCRPSWMNHVEDVENNENVNDNEKNVNDNDSDTVLEIKDKKEDKEEYVESDTEVENEMFDFLISLYRRKTRNE